MTGNADLFNPPRSPLPPVREHGPWALTNSNGGGYYIIWRFGRVYARGGMTMLDAIWQRVSQGTTHADQASAAP